MSNRTTASLSVRDTLRGRRRIYTTKKEITRDNLLEVLSNAFGVHIQNQTEIQYLFDYELGEQPLQREKIVRPEVDVKISENAANYVVEFKKGYFWGIPPVLIQHADKEMRKENDAKSDDLGISALNEMFLNALDISYENQILGDFVEKCGIGHRLVEVKTEFDEEDSKYALVNLYTLDSRYAFCIYNQGVGQKKVLGVTYVKGEDDRYHFTCYTDKKVYELVGLGTDVEIKESVNVLGMIPVIEYNRAIDRTGCFERHISYMDGLNILVSDLANDTAQTVQQIWWGNDVSFTQPDGTEKKPESGDWVLTYSGTEKNPKIQPLSSGLDTAATLSAISFEWNRLLQKCKVPIQQESVGGGSTGTATSMASGWQTAEVDALREESVVSRGFKEELRLILRAIKLVPSRVLDEDSPLRTVRAADVDFHFNRNRNYDLSIKANTMATLINAGMHGRHAIKLSEISPDAETVWNDSKAIIEQKQHKMFADDPVSVSSNKASDGTKVKSDTVNEDRTLQDSSDQTSNSPFLGNINTNQN